MKLVPICLWPASTKRLAKRHGFEWRTYEDGFAWIDPSGKLMAYCLLQYDPAKIVIDWIYAKPGAGTQFLKKIETKLFQTHKRIELFLSMDRGERDQTVLRRLNFYIKNQYRAQSIKYRPIGPLLTMVKVSK
jgi:hypothetical protein